MDPTEAEEFRLPNGGVMWIAPAAVHAARNETGGDMATQVSKVGDATTVTTCKKTGVYEISGTRFRFKEGDKIPVTAKMATPGERPIRRQTVAGNRLAQQRAAAKKPRKQAGESGESGGDEPTE